METTLNSLVADHTDPADRLDALADVVEANPERWRQGSFYSDRDGETCFDYRKAHAACYLGLVRIAYGSEDTPVWMASITLDDNNPGPADWNDDPDRKPEEIAAALRETARMERQVPRL